MIFYTALAIGEFFLIDLPRRFGRFLWEVLGMSSYNTWRSRSEHAAIEQAETRRERDRLREDLRTAMIERQDVSRALRETRDALDRLREERASAARTLDPGEGVPELGAHWEERLRRAGIAVNEAPDRPPRMIDPSRVRNAEISVSADPFANRQIVTLTSSLNLPAGHDESVASIAVKLIEGQLAQLQKGLHANRSSYKDFDGSGLTFKLGVRKIITDEGPNG